MTDPIVSTAWLAERLGEADVRVVDGSWHMPNAGRSGHAEYLEAHIPGAVFFDIDAIADRTVDLPHMLPTPEAFAQAAEALGLPRAATIVVYDSAGLFSAARVWWTLRVMGYPNVFVLDGGLPRWRAEGRPLEAGEVRPARATVTPAFEPELVRGLDDVRRILGTGEACMLDARSAARFRGEAAEPRPGVRSGRMRGAANLPYDQVLNGDALKPAAELREAFAQAGIDLGRPIVTTCGSGVTASVLALALARLGLDRVAVYDGSWAEWGGRTDTEVVTGAC
jgi:thiosulfate/3-mercaptopyruvate sulfurtransferase